MKAALKKLRGRRKLATVVGTLCLGVTGVAYADYLTADGDGLAPVADNNMSLGNICLNQTESKSALLAIFRSGGNGETFKDGSSVTVAATSATGGASATVSAANTITMPANWSGQPEHSVTPGTVTATVGATPTTRGTFNGSVLFRATGIKQSNENSLVREDTMGVSWKGIECVPPTSSAAGTFADGSSYTAGSWTGQNVTVTLSGSDTGGSGLKEIRYTTDGSAPSATNGTVVATGSSFTVSSEGTTTIKHVAIDNAGNVESPVKTYTVKIDKTDPNVAIVSPGDASSTSASSVTVSGTASDSGSGVATVTVNGAAATLDTTDGTFSRTGVTLSCGSNPITAVATDAAGRTRSASITVTRSCHKASYLQPLDSTSDGTTKNTVKYGRVVPVKVQVLAGTANQTDQDISAPTIKVWRLPACTAVSSDQVETSYDAGSSNGGGTAFRWDASAQTWIYNLDTKAMGLDPRYCYRIDVLLDGSSISTEKWAVLQTLK